MFHFFNNIRILQFFFQQYKCTLVIFKPTSQNCTPLQLFPIASNGGDHVQIHITLGMMRRMAPATPDLAGRPTYKHTITSEGQ